MTELTVPIPVTIVNHVGVDIGCSADAVWKAILEEYIEARKFRDIGYSIEPLDDPAALLGGYRMRVEQDGAVVDDRICRITERDEIERRLSLFADYGTPPRGMTVYATYHANAAGSASRYTIDCHTQLRLDRPATDGPAEVAAAVAEITSQYDAALIGYLESVKAKLEAAHA